MVEVDLGSRVERQTLTPLSRLTILVHPMFGTAPNTINYHEYHQARESAYGSHLLSYLPQDQDQLLLVMPFTMSDESFMIMVRRTKKETKGQPSWIEVYRKLLGFSKVKGTVRLAPDILCDEVDDLIEGIEEKGKTIDGRTEIILGGEYQEDCVQTVATRLLSVPAIQEVKIDIRASVTLDQEVNAIGHDDLSVDQTKHRYDERYIYLTKPPVFT